MERPSRIQKAMIEGNTDYLSAAGRKGALVTNERFKYEQMMREFDAIDAEERRIAAIKEEQVRMKQANRHIIDPDGNDLDYNSTNTTSH